MAGKQTTAYVAKMAERLKCGNIELPEGKVGMRRGGSGKAKLLLLKLPAFQGQQQQVLKRKSGKAESTLNTGKEWRGVHSSVQACQMMRDVEDKVTICGIPSVSHMEFDLLAYQGVLPEIALVEEQDQITHDLNLDDELDDESYLDAFRVDPDFLGK
ncbi:unnamed protein product [Calypogeia fissa]